MADQSGDPPTLDQTPGVARHGEDASKARPMFAALFVVKTVLGSVGAVYERCGEQIYKEDSEVRPAWRSTDNGAMNVTAQVILVEAS